MTSNHDTPAGFYEWLNHKWCSKHKTILVRMPMGDNLFCPKCHTDSLAKSQETH